MVVNPDKFQFIIINRLGKLKDSYELLIDNHKIDLENSITLLSIEIDNRLNFEKHVTALCQKAGCQLNALLRIHKYIGFQEMKMLLDSFIFFEILTIVSFSGITTLRSCHRKRRKYRNVL